MIKKPISLDQGNAKEANVMQDNIKSKDLAEPANGPYAQDVPKALVLSHLPKPKQQVTAISETPVLGNKTAKSKNDA